ncbi:MAG TPA: C40 family peptidase [Salinimicrobium sp.]|nr:C40 family peptidase [Salinimicrobium sp.]
MRKVFLIIFTITLLTSCGSSKPSVVTTKKEAGKTKVRPSKSSDKKIDKIIDIAESFEGTPYKFGGTTSKGMDCSGLIYTACLSEDVKIPRTSKAMSQYGRKISEREIAEGDFLFFGTDKNSKNVNHVGLVVKKKSGKIFFIHSTTSRGVIISSLDEKYWKESFVMVRRII